MIQINEYTVPGAMVISTVSSKPINTAQRIPEGTIMALTAPASSLSLVKYAAMMILK